MQQLFQTAEAPNVSETDAEVMKAYVQFISEYGRSYASKKHASQKYETFKRNYLHIKDHNKHESVLPFVMGVNQFTDLTAEEFAARLRLEVPKVLTNLTSKTHVHEHKAKTHHHHKSSGNPNVKSSKKIEKIPDYVNWHEQGAVLDPPDQQTCGSCWAFTTAATMDALSVISGKFEKPPGFSMQQLLDCDTGNDGCEGGWMYKAYDYTRTHGMMLDKDYPYTVSANHSKCKYNQTKTIFNNVGMVQEKNMANDDLKALVAKQPIGVGIFTSTNFQFYKTGVLTEEFLECSDPKNDVNHGVTVIGYGLTKGDDTMS